MPKMKLRVSKIYKERIFLFVVDKINVLFYYKHRFAGYEILSYEEWLFAMIKVDKFLYKINNEFFYTKLGKEYFLGNPDEEA